MLGRIASGPVDLGRIRLGRPKLVRRASGEVKGGGEAGFEVMLNPARCRETSDRSDDLRTWSGGNLEHGSLAQS